MFQGSGCSCNKHIRSELHKPFI